MSKNLDSLCSHAKLGFEFLLSLQLELFKSYVTLNNPIKSTHFMNPNLKGCMLLIYGQIHNLYGPRQVQNHRLCIYGFEKYFIHFLYQGEYIKYTHT